MDADRMQEYLRAWELRDGFNTDHFTRSRGQAGLVRRCLLRAEIDRFIADFERERRGQ